MRPFFGLLLWVGFSALLVGGEQLKISVNAEHAILMNAKTGAVLFEKEAHVPVNPASTTKIATAIYVLSQGISLDEKMTARKEALASITPQAKKQSNYRAPPHWLETDGTHVGIKLGEEFSLHDLMYALFLASANDGANVIAQHVGKTIPQFMEGVNVYLKTLGCKNTSYNNPSGLSHPEHLTTAFDLALMTKEGLKNPFFRKVVSTVRYTIPPTNLEPERPLLQGNRLLRPGPFFYPKAIGVKTGTTLAAGKNLVAAAHHEGRELIAVALGYRGSREELYHDIVKMFEKAFQQEKSRKTFLDAGVTPLSKAIQGGHKPLKTYLKAPLFYDFFPVEEEPLKVQVTWKMPPLPIAAGEIVGEVQVVNTSGVVMAEQPLLALEEVCLTKKERFSQFFSWTHRKKQVIFWGGSGLFLLSFFIFRKRLARK